MPANFNNLREIVIKSTWKQINSIIRPNRINKKNIINKIGVNDITYVTKHDILNVLNTYFVNIGKRLYEPMNAVPYDHYQYLKGNYINSLFFAPVSSADVEEIILTLRDKPVISTLRELPALIFRNWVHFKQICI